MTNLDQYSKSDDAIALRLRALQTDATAPYDWVEFKRRSDERRRPQWHRAAIAALFVLVIVGAALWGRFSHVGESGKNTQTTANDYQTSFNTLPNDANEKIDTYANTSATSQWLASLPSEPTIVRVGTRVAVVDLEDHIAWIDDLLSAAQVESAQPAHIRTLQRERAQLINSLAQVRYAETLAAQR
jgi:hypothetical protein